MQELNKTSSRGFGVSIEEFGPDVIAVAAPIFNINNVVIASIAVAALKSRISNDNQVEKLGKSVIKSASDISKELALLSINRSSYSFLKIIVSALFTIALVNSIL